MQLMLKNVAKYYICLSMPADILSLIDDASLHVFPSLGALVWLASVVTGTPYSAHEMAKSVVNRYKTPSYLKSTAVQSQGGHGHGIDNRPCANQDYRRDSPKVPAPGDRETTGRDNGGGHNDPYTVGRNIYNILSLPDSKKFTAVASMFRIKTFRNDRFPETHQARPIVNEIRNYDACVVQLWLSNRQKALLFSNIFTDSARVFFFTKIDVSSMSFNALVKIMLTEFDSKAWQLESQSELKSVALSRIMKENGTPNIIVDSDCLYERIY